MPDFATVCVVVEMERQGRQMREIVTEAALRNAMVVHGAFGGSWAFRRVRPLLWGAGHEVFQVNPKTELVEGEHCYPNLGAIPGGVDGVVAVGCPEDPPVDEPCRGLSSRVDGAGNVQPRRICSPAGA